MQSRWVFTNPAESYLTKAQEVGLNYHMKCEQYAHSAARSFFNFNGTAGECSAVSAAGPWAGLECGKRFGAGWARIWPLMLGGSRRVPSSHCKRRRPVPCHVSLTRDAAHPPFPRLPAWPSRPAGVWRLACIEHAGGWNSRTTVEDMDLALRAYIRGWGAIFLDDVTCLNEVGRGAGREGPLVC